MTTTPDNLTVPNTGLALQTAVDALTAYSRTRTYDELIAAVYKPGREPGGPARWQETWAARERPPRCGVGGCLRPRYGPHRWCQMHHARWMRTGYPLGRQDPRWQAEHRPPPPVIPSVESVAAEMRAALAALNEWMGE